MKPRRTAGFAASVLAVIGLTVGLVAGCASAPRVSGWGKIAPGIAVKLGSAVWRGTTVPPVAGLLDTLVRQAASASGLTVDHDTGLVVIEPDFSATTRLVGSRQCSTVVCVLRAHSGADGASDPANLAVEVVAIADVNADRPNAAELYELARLAFQELAR